MPIPDSHTVNPYHQLFVHLAPSFAVLTFFSRHRHDPSFIIILTVTKERLQFWLDFAGKLLAHTRPIGPRKISAEKNGRHNLKILFVLQHTKAILLYQVGLTLTTTSCRSCNQFCSRNPANSGIEIAPHCLSATLTKVSLLQWTIISWAERITK